MNLNSMCVHQGTILAAAGFEHGTPRFKVNHATNELSWRHFSLKPCRAELLFLFFIYFCHVSSFPSFEAGIANAISNFKWQKNIYFITENSRLPNVMIVFT